MLSRDAFLIVIKFGVVGQVFHSWKYICVSSEVWHIPERRADLPSHCFRSLRVEILA